MVSVSAGLFVGDGAGVGGVDGEERHGDGDGDGDGFAGGLDVTGGGGGVFVAGILVTTITVWAGISVGVSANSFLSISDSYRPTGLP